MGPYPIDSGIAVTDVRVANFRSLADVEVSLGDLTVLIGANNAGKTSFLDAMYAAIGAGRKALGADDVRIEPGEDVAPKSRVILIDVRLRPVDIDGKLVESFPPGSFWTALWGSAILFDIDATESLSFRTSLTWNALKADYVVDRRPLKTWAAHDAWLATGTTDKQISAAQLEPITFHYVDAKRDLDEEFRKAGSFWRRMTDDLGLQESDVADLESSLASINQAIVDKSDVLKHLKIGLADLQTVVAADSSGIDIAPVARKIRDLSKGVTVSFSNAGAQSFPLARHGMGTRSLGSLLVFRSYAAWRFLKASAASEQVHSVLALEEPESHLHPQAQRTLFAHIKRISGQRVVSTHSPYFAGQAELEELCLFIKRDGKTVAKKLNLADPLIQKDKRKVRDTVIESRGDLLFARGVVFFEGQTEEMALPIWAHKYWDCSIHELGFSFVRVNGNDYFPFVWLAENLQIPWYIFADGEPTPLVRLQKCLNKAGLADAASCPNVVVIPDGKNFETQLLAEGYLAEVRLALNETHGSENYLDEFIKTNHGLEYKNNKGVRDYQSVGGLERAAHDAMKASKTEFARPIARTICGCEEPSRRFPESIAKLFEIIGSDYALSKAVDPVI